MILGSLSILSNSGYSVGFVGFLGFFKVTCLYSLHTENFTLPGPKELYFLCVWNLLSCSVTWKVKVFTATCHVIVISVEIIITSA